jgi:hypothetical protein
MKTSSEVASLLKLARVTVIKHAQNLGVQKIGRDYIFTDKDIEKIKARIGKVGRPVKSK